MLSVLRLSPSVRDDGAISTFHRILYTATCNFGLSATYLFYSVLKVISTVVEFVFANSLF
jgi:hypothetical protein